MQLEPIVDEFFRRGAALDGAGMAAMCRPDAVVHQHAGAPTDPAGLVDLTSGLSAMGVSVVYSDVRRVIGATAVTEQHLVTLTLADGQTVAADVCVVLRFDADGMITRIDEYLDSAALAGLRP